MGSFCDASSPSIVLAPNTLKELLSKARADAREGLNEMRQGVDPKQKRALARAQAIAAQERDEKEKVERRANSFRRRGRGFHQEICARED